MCTHMADLNADLVSLRRLPLSLPDLRPVTSPDVPQADEGDYTLSFIPILRNGTILHVQYGTILILWHTARNARR